MLAGMMEKNTQRREKKKKNNAEAQGENTFGVITTKKRPV